MAAGRSAAHQAARHRDKAAEHRRKAEQHEVRAAELLPDGVGTAVRSGEGAEPRPGGVHRRRRGARVRLPRPSRRTLRSLGLGVIAVAVLLCVPFAAHQLTDVLTGAEPIAAAAAPTVAAPVVYRGCGALRAAYPNGVKAKGAANAGRKVRPVSAVDTALATANGRLDDDGDGLVCERLRAHHRTAKR